MSDVSSDESVSSVENKSSQKQKQNQFQTKYLKMLKMKNLPPKEQAF